MTNLYYNCLKSSEYAREWLKSLRKCCFWKQMCKMTFAVWQRDTWFLSSCRQCMNCCHSIKLARDIEMFRPCFWCDTQLLFSSSSEIIYVTQNIQQPTAFELFLSHSQVAVVKVALPILISRPEIGSDLGYGCWQVFPIAASWLFFSSPHVFPAVADGSSCSTCPRQSLWEQGWGLCTDRMGTAGTIRSCDFQQQHQSTPAY